MIINIQKTKFSIISFTITLFFILFFIADVFFSNFILKKDYFSCYQTSENFYFLKSNCKAYERYASSSYKVITNDFGMRVLGKKINNKNKKNFFFVGDSQVYGIGLEYKDTFVGMLEKNYEEYNFYNLAVSSYSPTVYYYKINEFIKLLKPKKIFILIDLGDIYEETYRWKASYSDNTPRLIDSKKESNEISKNKSFLNTIKKFKDKNFKGSKIIFFHLREFFRAFEEKVFFSRNEELNLQKKAIRTEIGKITYQKPPKDKDINLMKLNLENKILEISNLKKKYNFDLYLITLPYPETLEYGQNEFNWENFVLGLCKKSLCKKNINLFPAFLIHKNKEADWIKKYFINNDFHPNKNGHYLIYNEVKNYINQ